MSTKEDPQAVRKALFDPAFDSSRSKDATMLARRIATYSERPECQATFNLAMLAQLMDLAGVTETVSVPALQALEKEVLAIYPELEAFVLGEETSETIPAGELAALFPPATEATPGQLSAIPEIVPHVPTVEEAATASATVAAAPAAPAVKAFFMETPAAPAAAATPAEPAAERMIEVAFPGGAIATVRESQIVPPGWVDPRLVDPASLAPTPPAPPAEPSAVEQAWTARLEAAREEAKATGRAKKAKGYMPVWDLTDEATAGEGAADRFRRNGRVATLINKGPGATGDEQAAMLYLDGDQGEDWINVFEVVNKLELKASQAAKLAKAPPAPPAPPAVQEVDEQGRLMISIDTLRKNDYFRTRAGAMICRFMAITDDKMVSAEYASGPEVGKAVHFMRTIKVSAVWFDELQAIAAQAIAEDPTKVAAVQTMAAEVAAVPSLGVDSFANIMEGTLFQVSSELALHGPTAPVYCVKSHGENGNGEAIAADGSDTVIRGDEQVSIVAWSPDKEADEEAERERETNHDLAESHRIYDETSAIFQPKLEAARKLAKETKDGGMTHRVVMDLKMWRSDKPGKEDRFYYKGIEHRLVGLMSKSGETLSATIQSMMAPGPREGQVEIDPLTVVAMVPGTLTKKPAAPAPVEAPPAPPAEVPARPETQPELDAALKAIAAMPVAPFPVSAPSGATVLPAAKALELIRALTDKVTLLSGELAVAHARIGELETGMLAIPDDLMVHIREILG